MPKKVVAITGLGAAFLAMSMAGAKAMPPDKFFQKTSTSVWRVMTYDTDGIALSMGSAVVIAKETLLTNCHVLAKSKRFVIKQDNASYEGKLQYIDVERDLCQITVRNLNAPAVPLGNSDSLIVGQHVYTLGNPENLELTLSEGLISALRQDETSGMKLIQTSAPFSMGSSGGGLFDEEGRLIGITTMIHRRGQNLNFAMPINYIKELPARSAVAVAKREAAAPQTGGANAAQGKTSPVASGYADLNDVEKLGQISPRARTGYEDFLKKPLPRAFALAEGGGWWASWGTKPKNPNSSTDPALRVVPDCEQFHHRRCTIYVIDNVVVYRPPQ